LSRGAISPTQDTEATIDFARRCPAELERTPQQFDVLAIDAFSSDSIPVHLITAEAPAIYQQHMKPDGDRISRLEPLRPEAVVQMTPKACRTSPGC
jgi:hypothetical protein